MNIKKGSSFNENARAIINERYFMKKAPKHKMLLVEGIEDINVIRDFYIHKNQKLIFKLVLANDPNLEEPLNFAGKKNSIVQHENLRTQGHNVVSLLDRDYDFFLNEDITDPKIIYYDYFELENYLFESSIFKVVVKNIFNYEDQETYDMFLVSLSKVEYALYPYILLCLLREVNYRKSILDSDKLENVLNIIKKKPASMMQMSNLAANDPLDRILEYIQKELGRVELSIEKVESILQEHCPNFSFFDSKNSLDIFKYYIKGKTICSSLPLMLKNEAEKNSDLKNGNVIGNLDNLISRLRLEWIPTISKEFEYLLQKIEVSFE
ncbi:DUF4435 domain-containing protein [Saccharibacillus sacchari]|uniref:DUF4435 domain-containing protein n=1 Tax=Saccharibacillus sacchari TaxID=456493 RepID=A0ACC6P9D3_9BACL